MIAKNIWNRKWNEEQDNSINFRQSNEEIWKNLYKGEDENTMDLYLYIYIRVTCTRDKNLASTFQGKSE